MAGKCAIQVKWNSFIAVPAARASCTLVCDDLNCPLRPEVALAEICKSKTLISFAVGAPVEIAQPFDLQAIGDHAVE